MRGTATAEVGDKDEDDYEGKDDLDYQEIAQLMTSGTNSSAMMYLLLVPYLSKTTQLL